jgi:hypothetical protein
VVQFGIINKVYNIIFAVAGGGCSVKWHLVELVNSTSRDSASPNVNLAFCISPHPILLKARFPRNSAPRTQGWVEGPKSTFLRQIGHHGRTPYCGCCLPT